MRGIVSSGCIGLLGYLLLAGSVAGDELATGVALALLVAAWWALAARMSPLRFACSRRHLRVWALVAARLLPQTFAAGTFLLGAAFRSPAHQGHAHRRPFRPGPADDPAERARRATAVLAASLAPASYVVWTGSGRDEALLHVVSLGPRSDAEWLV